MRFSLISPSPLSHYPRWLLKLISSSIANGGLMDKQQIENRIEKIGTEIFQKTENVNSGNIFNKDWWYGKVMDWSMKNTQFKINMFRFVDVLPYLNSGSEVHRHLKEYFTEGGEKLPSFFNFGMGVGALAPGLLAKSLRKNVTEMARMFIAGEDPKDALKVLEKHRAKKVAFTADLLGEACLSEKEALEYQSRYIDMIQYLSKASETWKHDPLLDENHLGEIPKVNVSVKLSSLYSQIKIAAWHESKEILKERLRPVLQYAKERNVFLNLDLEQYEIKDLTIEVFKELAMEPAFVNYPHFGLVVQAYLRDSFKECESLIEYSKKRGTPVTVRLVKGAYWDYETIDSEQKRWHFPVYTNKKESDANYEKCAKLLLDNYQHIWLAIGSHNVRSISACIAYAEEKSIPKNAFEIQMLYGMADDFKQALIAMDFRVREYAPIGELIPGMAYLVRRLLENTSNESFLKSKFVDHTEIKELMKDPAENLEASNDFPATKERFYNEAMLDFVIPENRNKLSLAIESSKKQHIGPYKLFIEGKSVETSRKLDSLDPSDESLVGSFYLATEVEAEKAVKSALKALPEWSKTSVEKRASLLEALADKILERRFELIALEIREVGKTWSEADADITEAVDFCRYYAREMRRLDQPHRVGAVLGEVSMYHYRARGVSLVIAPWNFPLAILTGLVTSSLVTGNTVVMKPAEQSTITAAVLMDMIIEVGFPSEVVQFLPGIGEEVGEYLVNHSEIATIAFTGSKNVGLGIVQKAAKTKSGQTQVKKCVIEMGGKNAIIVDNDADLDVAIDGILYSCFAFAGQKCSACSRIIVVGDIYERFMERFLDSANSLLQDKASNPKAYAGPVIDEESKNRVLEFLDKISDKNKIAFQAEVPDQGFFVPFTIVTEVEPQDEIANTELFAPVVAILKAENIDEALKIANGTEYALTGGLFSRSPANIDKVREEFEVGNLYINRSCTGALVDRHPFGGYKMSGVGSKAGGPDYLLQFMNPRVVTENTMRQGFAPPENDSE